MISISRSASARVLLAFIVVVLNACSVIEKQEQTEAAKPVEETSESGSAAPVKAEEQEALSVNPYTVKRSAVPAAAQQRFTRAMEQFRQGELSGAERAFESLTRDYPSLSGPWLNLGLLYQHSERSALAPAQFEAAIRANSLNLNAYNQLGISLREQGKFEDAERQYLAALAIWPDHPSSHRNLAILYDLYMGREAEALVHYRRAWQLAPDPTLRIWMMDLQRRVSTDRKSEG